ncbi:hypothetical protein HNR48_001396 [Pseudoteredinibacter isoporae]|uniref:Secreted protein n=1 Tax=Pseudoteredinibacter isoporae TaxID=570281 RepID=A0A7X0MV87_9GAMM|nr:hypothetical protein [Pseudoteredinibacter isoporae]
MFKSLYLTATCCLLVSICFNNHAASDPGSGLEFTDLGSTLRIDGCTGGTCPANLNIPGNLASAPGKPVTEIGDTHSKAPTFPQ